MSDDSLGTDEIKDIFDYGRERKAYLAVQDRQIRANRIAIQSEAIRLNEAARLRNAKQVVFDFAEPSEDWGSI